MTSSTTPKRVLLSGDPPCYEDVATGAITPGMLLVRGANGVAAHATTGTLRHPALIAREEEYAGGSISDAYASGDTVPFYHCGPGDHVYMILESGANVAKGALLASNAAGKLEAASTNYAIAQALEAVNASGGDARIRVAII